MMFGVECLDLDHDVLSEMFDKTSRSVGGYGQILLS